MNPAKLKHNVDYAIKTGMKEIYLWGGEWWYWRKSHFNDASLWETARELKLRQ